ncbi:MAG TPA: serine/threonine-protein kinase [Actinoplanes sp.]|nr:serine/threonine-protein kinase [Actinoplanes sp.]
MSSPLHPDDPRRLGPYTLVGRLGEGGMGTVYLGQNPSGRRVAIKVVRSEYARDDRYRRRFRSEVNRARQVPPFCTAEVLDADPDHDPPYLVVEYIDGPNLTGVVRDHGPLALANLHSVAVGIATALTAVHGAGVIHRDLKPGNVLFTLGGIKVIDFGIARPLEATSHHTRTDHMVGTIAYMAPERFEPESAGKLSPAADIFSWGAVVAYAGTGRNPFSADSAPGTVMRILTRPPDLSGLSEPIRDLVELALAKEPQDRPTARELLDLLLASAPSPVAAVETASATTTGARKYEVPFLREVMQSAERSASAPASASARVAAPAPRPIVVRPNPVTRAIAGSGRSLAVPGRWQPRRWLTQFSVAATVLVMLVAGSLAYRALGNDGGDQWENPTSPAVPGTAGPGPSPATDPGGIQAILDGERRAVLHIREIGKDLILSADGSTTVSADTRRRTPITLVRSGTSYLLRAHRASGGQSCLGVKVNSPGSVALAAGPCAESDTNLFDLAPTGRADDLNRPAYFLKNLKYGTVQWSSDRYEIYVEPSDPRQVDTSFVFVDQGPA